MTQNCPACDRGYPDLATLNTHLKKAQAEGDKNHIDIIALEAWEEPEETFDPPFVEIPINSANAD